MIGLEALALYGLGAVAASYGLGAALFGPRVPDAPVKKTPLRVAVERQRAVPRPRKLLPAQIAEYVVAGIRLGGGNDYAIIVPDLDHEIRAWCAANNVVCPPIATMREAILAMPGVRKDRLRLNKSSPEHAYIRERQRLHEIANEYPTVYWVDDLPEAVCDDDSHTPVTADRSLTYPCPIPVRSVKRTVRSGKSQRSGQREKPCPAHDPNESWADLAREAA